MHSLDPVPAAAFCGPADIHNVPPHGGSIGQESDKVKTLRLVGMVAVVVALGACEDLAPETESRSAEAVLFDAEGNRIGEAVLDEVENNPVVVLRLLAWDLPPGLHGFHIHESGVCDSPTFETAGGDFNPYHKKHGLRNPLGPHAGDLPNLRVSDDGTVEVTLAIRRVTLGEGNHSLLPIQGTSLVIHADPDDGKSDPEGNSGDRIACGVIRLALSAK
jgi:Cu-Zn family superoxide dismutase